MCCTPGGDREEDEDGEWDRDVTTSPHCSEIPPSSGGGPRAVTPAVPWEWGQPLHWGGEAPRAVAPELGDAGRTGKSLMD